MTLSLIANELAPASLTALMVFVVPMWLVQFTLRCLSSADRAGLGMLIVVAVALALGLGQLFVPDQMELLQALVLAFGVVVPAIIIWRAKAETETSEGGSS